jgi:hypothetical protein
MQGGGAQEGLLEAVYVKRQIVHIDASCQFTKQI